MILAGDTNLLLQPHYSTTIRLLGLSKSLFLSPLLHSQLYRHLAFINITSSKKPSWSVPNWEIIYLLLPFTTERKQKQVSCSRPVCLIVFDRPVFPCLGLWHSIVLTYWNRLSDGKYQIFTRQPTSKQQTNEQKNEAVNEKDRPRDGAEE